MTPSEAKELDWLRSEAAMAARLADAERVAVLEDLCRTADAIAAAKTPEERRRDEAARRALDAPGKARYLALIERLEASSSRRR